MSDYVTKEEFNEHVMYSRRQDLRDSAYNRTHTNNNQLMFGLCMGLLSEVIGRMYAMMDKQEAEILHKHVSEQMESYKSSIKEANDLCESHINELEKKFKNAGD